MKSCGICAGQWLHEEIAMPAISKGARVCEACGSPIETTSAGDLGCINCLLGAGLDVEAKQAEGAIGTTPDQLGAYKIAHHSDGSAWMLGRGAMGVTYRAIDKALDRPVALKIINTDRGSRSAEARERFMREARAAAALRHPNVATVYQFGVREETGQFFYAMELVEGETLEERVRRLGPLDVLTTIDIALQVTAALEAAEECGLVHRDLKPGNLMLVASHDDETARASTQRGGYRNGRGVVATAGPGRRGGRRRVDKANEKLIVKVIDFGVAKAVAEKTNAMALTHGGFVGTPAFASPEQFTNAPVDVRSDIYSLGATLWFLLTGQMLFSGRTIEEIRDARRSKPLPIDQLEAARVPRRLVSLLSSMLAIEPAARPDGAHELARKLQAIRASITGRGKTAERLALAATIAALATIVAFRVFDSSATKATRAPIPEKSVAVLPFENLSGDSNNAYFAAGIQEEILTRLAGIAELKVISRASTQRYQTKPRNLAEIAKQLGVANILEGSVQKAADQVRVNVHLINAQTDSHLWADTYDRKLTDIFGVQSEIAKGIAAALRAKLTGTEKQALAVKPTNNPEAYDAYLRGLTYQARIDPGHGLSPSEEAAGFYERAVELDPNFALAWARLSRANAHLFFSFGKEPARREAAKHALETAQRLEPNSAETLLALGHYQSWVLKDYELGKATFSRVGKLLPGSSEVPRYLGAIAVRLGNWDESIAYFEQALVLDPRNVELLSHAALTYGWLRQFPAALKLYDRALDITPNDPDVLANKASIYQAQGDLQKADRLLSGINWQTAPCNAVYSRSDQLKLERNYSELIRFLRAQLDEKRHDSHSPRTKASLQMILALCQHMAGDTDGAKVTAEPARNWFEQFYDDSPHDAGRAFSAAVLSNVYAAMGQKELALEAAERAVKLWAPHKDSLSGSQFDENLTVIQTMFGENSRAIATLTQLLKTPYRPFVYNLTPVTPALLRLDPIWDALRGDPAFQKLCEEKQPPAKP